MTKSKYAMHIECSLEGLLLLGYFSIRSASCAIFTIYHLYLLCL